MKKDLESYKRRFQNIIENSNNIGKSAKLLTEQEIPTDEVNPDEAVPEVPTDAIEPSTDPNPSEIPSDIPSDGTDIPTGDEMDSDVTTDMGGESEGLDITELVNQIKNVEQKMDTVSNFSADVTGKINNISQQISALEGGFSQFNALSSKLDSIAQRIETIREKTPEEKLEMRSLDSAPFTEKPKDFFTQKQNELDSVGKNYEFTPALSDAEIKQSFKPDYNR